MQTESADRTCNAAPAGLPHCSPLAAPAEAQVDGVAEGDWRQPPGCEPRGSKETGRKETACEQIGC